MSFERFFLTPEDGGFKSHMAFLDRKEKLRSGQLIRVFGYGTLPENESYYVVEVKVCYIMPGLKKL